MRPRKSLRLVGTKHMTTGCVSLPCPGLGRNGGVSVGCGATHLGQALQARHQRPLTSGARRGDAPLAVQAIEDVVQDMGVSVIPEIMLDADMADVVGPLPTHPLVD